MSGYYAVYRKRRTTSNVRIRDRIGMVWCDERRLPISREARQRYAFRHAWWMFSDDQAKEDGAAK